MQAEKEEPPSQRKPSEQLQSFFKPLETISKIKKRV